MYLVWDFSIIVVSAISYFCYHLISTKVNKHIIINLQNHVYSSVQANKNINKISLSILTDIFACVDFNKNLLYKACFLIKSIVILFIIIKYNLMIALVIVAVSFVSFLLLRLTDKKIQKNNLALSGFQNESLELFNSIQQGADTEQNQKVSTMLKNKYFGIVGNSIKTTNRISLLYNINNNFITLILKTTVFLSTLFLITQIKSTALTLSLYLILTPYLTSSAQNLISFFDLFSEFGTIENALLNFESLTFQSSSPDDDQLDLENFDLTFFNASTKPEDKSEPKLHELNFKLEPKTFNLFVGSVDSGKETIYNLLNKKTTLSSGSILVGNKNIDSISSKHYSTIISFTNKSPYFYNISILENLYLVCQNKSKINKVLGEWGLLSKINKLKNKLDTLINADLNSNLVYFLGIAKCFLSGSKIICVYGQPSDFLKEENDLFETIIKKLKKECMLLIFSSNEKLSHLADNVFSVKNGKIQLIENQNKNV